MTRREDIGKDKRREQITSIIKKEQSVRTIRLAEEFGVSREVILKDMMALEKEGIMVRERGGAVLYNTGKEKPFSLRRTDHAREKEKISKIVTSQIEDGSVIFLTNSTTNLYVASYLEMKKNLTIFTNSLDIMNLMKDSRHRLVIIGGMYYPKGRHMIGSYAEEMIRNVYFDYSIFSMDGCLGMSGPGTNEVESHGFSNLVFRNSRRRILVSDQSKLDIAANYQVSEFRNFDVIVMDLLTPEHRRQFIEENKADPDKLLEVQLFKDQFSSEKNES